MTCKAYDTILHITSQTVQYLQSKCHITRHTSHVKLKSHTSHVAHHTSHITRHTSHVAHHTSHVTRHTSHVTCYLQPHVDMKCWRATATKVELTPNFKPYNPKPKPQTPNPKPQTPNPKPGAGVRHNVTRLPHAHALGEGEGGDELGFGVSEVSVSVFMVLGLYFRVCC